MLNDIIWISDILSNTTEVDGHDAMNVYIWWQTKNIFRKYYFDRKYFYNIISIIKWWCSRNLVLLNFLITSFFVYHPFCYTCQKMWQLSQRFCNRYSKDNGYNKCVNIFLRTLKTANWVSRCNCCQRQLKRGDILYQKLFQI